MKTGKTACGPFGDVIPLRQLKCMHILENGKCNHIGRKRGDLGVTGNSYPYGGHPAISM